MSLPQPLTTPTVPWDVHSIGVDYFFVMFMVGEKRVRKRGRKSFLDVRRKSTKFEDQATRDKKRGQATFSYKFKDC